MHDKWHFSNIEDQIVVCKREKGLVVVYQCWCISFQSNSYPLHSHTPISYWIQPSCLSQRLCRLHNFKSETLKVSISIQKIHLTLTGSLKINSHFSDLQNFCTFCPWVEKGYSITSVNPSLFHDLICWKRPWLREWALQPGVASYCQMWPTSKTFITLGWKLFECRKICAQQLFN